MHKSAVAGWSCDGLKDCGNLDDMFVSPEGKLLEKDENKKTINAHVGHYGDNYLRTDIELKGQGITKTGTRTYKVTDRALEKLEKIYNIVWDDRLDDNYKLVKIKEHEKMGKYKETPIDEEKKNADFRITAGNYIIWHIKHGGHGEQVTKRKLEKLKKEYSWVTDY